ncbi:MAG: hypothetical protein AB7F91_08485 [Parvularculaceae bacterium]|nr:hypothetical protein [Parvularculaceae bacterium]
MMRFALLAALACLSAPSVALAQTGEEAVADVLACQAVKGSKARLRCFEAALPALSDAHPGAVALAAGRAEAAREAATEQAKEDFGLFQREEKTASNEFERDAFGENDLRSASRDEDDEVKRVEATAVEVGKNNRGKIFVVLDNGQVWRQVNGDKSTPYIPRDADGLPVVIKKGLMGSYFIKVGKAKDAFKAERIK